MLDTVLGSVGSHTMSATNTTQATSTSTVPASKPKQAT
jgi:hypothetical protein